MEGSTMNVDVYVSNDQQWNAAKALEGALGDKEPAWALRAINLAEPQPDGIPPKVLNRILSDGGKGLPLTLLNGEEFLIGRLPTPDDLRGLSGRRFESKGFTECPDYVEDSSVQFPTRSRIHINIIVKDLQESLKFYRVLFGQEPTKVREGYAKFELQDPPVNLAMLEDPHGGAKPHFGIQVKSTRVIRQAVQRYAEAGFYMYDEGETACCFALQKKTWVVDPEGRQWEVYVNTDNGASAGCASDCICYSELEPSMREAPKDAPPGQGS